jgi:hypothetical protein
MDSADTEVPLVGWTSIASTSGVRDDRVVGEVIVAQFTPVFH